MNNSEGRTNIELELKRLIADRDVLYKSVQEHEATIERLEKQVEDLTEQLENPPSPAEMLMSVWLRESAVGEHEVFTTKPTDGNYVIEAQVKDIPSNHALMIPYLREQNVQKHNVLLAIAEALGTPQITPGDFPAMIRRLRHENKKLKEYSYTIWQKALEFADKAGTAFKEFRTEKET